MTETDVMERSATTNANETELEALSEQVTALTELVELLTQDQAEMSEKIETLEVALASSSSGDELVFNPRQDVAETEQSVENETSSLDTDGGEIIDKAAEEHLATLSDAPRLEGSSPMPEAPDDAFVMQGQEAISDDPGSLEDAPASEAESGDEQVSLDAPEVATLLGSAWSEDANSEDEGSEVLEPSAVTDFFGPPAPKNLKSSPEHVRGPEQPQIEDIPATTQDTYGLPDAPSGEDATPDSLSDNIFVEDAMSDDMSNEHLSSEKTQTADPSFEAQVSEAAQIGHKTVLPNPLEALEERMMARIAEMTPPKDLIEALKSKLDRLTQNPQSEDTTLPEAVANFEAATNDVLERFEAIASRLQEAPQRGADHNSLDVQTTEKLAELISEVRAQKTSTLKRHEVVEIFKDMQGEFLDDLRIAMAELIVSDPDTLALMTNS